MRLIFAAAAAAAAALIIAAPAVAVTASASSPSQGAQMAPPDHSGAGQNDRDRERERTRQKEQGTFRPAHHPPYRLERDRRVGVGIHVNVPRGRIGIHFGERRPRVYNRHLYNRAFWANRKFHWRAYVRPHGWYYRRWVYGQFLPVIFWTHDYWINDYWAFDLPDPPYDGAVWVRYGDDAILVDADTGEIIQVVYGLFD